MITTTINDNNNQMSPVDCGWWKYLINGCHQSTSSSFNARSKSMVIIILSIESLKSMWLCSHFCFYLFSLSFELSAKSPNFHMFPIKLILLCSMFNWLVTVFAMSTGVISDHLVKLNIIIWLNRWRNSIKLICFHTKPFVFVFSVISNTHF